MITGRTAMILAAAQYTMKKDWYQLALIEWKRLNPLLRREQDFTAEARMWVLQRAEELMNSKH